MENEQNAPVVLDATTEQGVDAGNGDAPVMTATDSTVSSDAAIDATANDAVDVVINAEEDTAPAVEIDGQPLSEVTTSATEQVKQWGWDIQHLDWANPSWDVFIFLFFIVSSLLYGISLGRDRIIIIMVSMYMSLALIKVMPDFVLNIMVNGQYAYQIGTFITLFVVLFFLLSRSALSRTLGLNARDGSWYQTLIFSILHVGLLLSITLSFLPPEMLEKFAPVTRELFTQKWSQFFWIATPILAMIVFGGRSDDDN